MHHILSTFLLFLASAVVGMAIAMPVAWPAESRPDPGPINLGVNDAYRRDGTLIDMKTCLAVADDREASALLTHGAVEAAFDRSPVERAEALRRIHSAIKEQPGYGTLLACAQIVAAWYSRTLHADGRGRLSAVDPPVQPNDGRVEHGALVIDLSIGFGARALIDPVALTRILTSQGLVPARAYGGIVVRDAIVNRALMLHNLRLTKPITFVDVKFAGRPYRRTVLGIDHRASPTALSIAGAQMHGHLVFQSVEFCGDVVIDRSRFDEALAFRDVEQRAIGCRAPVEDDQVALRISDSQLAQGLSLSLSRFPAVTVAGIEAAEIDVERVDFGTGFQVVESDLGELDIACSILAENALIARNHVGRDLRIEGAGPTFSGGQADRTCGDWWREHAPAGLERPARLGVENNRIGGGLMLSGFAGGRLRSPLRLVGNRVAAASRVLLPTLEEEGKVWVGDVDFLGSSYEGTLEIGLTVPPEGDRIDGRAEDRFCPEIGRGRALDGIAVELRAVRARTLLWNLPLTCDYRWLGYGLTYDLWLRGGLARKSLGAAARQATPAMQDHLALRSWRLTLRYHDSPSLDAMSRYLADKGQYLDSRNILLEAKRLNYVPTCPPDGSVVGCAGSIGSEMWQTVAGGVGLIDRAAADETASAAGRGEAAAPDIFEEMKVWTWRLVMLILLWPGGYGAEPERALILLIGFFALSWVIYMLYSRSMRQRLADAWQVIDPVLRRHLDRESRPLPNVEAHPGIAEPPARFDHLQILAGRNGWVWPTEEEWTGMTDAQRLREINGPVLRRVRAWEDAAFGDDLQDLRALRQYLEDFGNTDIPGFGRFDINKMPTRFSHHLYSFDTMLPVIDLHAYSNYYPIAGWARMLSVFQHVCGWWWVSVFIASAAIL